MDLENRISSAGMLKSILRLMCLFSIFVFVNDMAGIFLGDSPGAEIIFDLLHILQYISVFAFLIRYKIRLSDLLTGGKKISPKLVAAALLMGFFTSFLGSRLDELMPGVPVADAAYSLRHTVFFMIFAGIMAPVFEETEFRGLLFQSLKGRMSAYAAAVLSALMFMVLHTGGILISAFIVGIFSAVIFLWTGQLIYSVAIHFAGNIIPVMLLGLSLFLKDSAGDEAAAPLAETNASWAPETIVSILLPAAVLAALFICFYKRTEHGKGTGPQPAYEKTDKTLLPYFVFYFAVCISSTVIQFLHQAVSA